MPFLLNILVYIYYGKRFKGLANSDDYNYNKITAKWFFENWPIKYDMKYKYILMFSLLPLIVS